MNKINKARIKTDFEFLGRKFIEIEKNVDPVSCITNFELW